MRERRHIITERRGIHAAAAAIAAVAAAGCAGDGGEAAAGGAGDGGTADAGPPWTPDRACPGDPDCEDEGDGVLLAGAAARDVTPAIPEPWTDVNGNNEWDPGTDTFEDRDGDGELDAVWLVNANGRAAIGKREGEEIWVRCLALRRDRTTVALCAGDFYGYFIDQVLLAREALDPALGVDLLLMNASHTHSGPDTLGQSGRNETESGVDPDYDRLIRERTVEAVAEAVGALRPATVTYGAIDTVDDTPEGPSTRRYLSDTRDPIVFSPRLTALHFADAESDEPIATMVNWAAHPEFSRWHHPYLSADYPAYLRARVEERLGGVAIFYQGALGGQVGPGEVTVTDPDTGDELHEGCVGDPETGVRDCTPGFRMARIVGEAVADLAVQAIEQGATESDAPLSFKQKQVLARLDNLAFQAGFGIGLFHREAYGYDRDRPITPDNTPEVLTEVDTLRIGRAQIVTAPGELHPELFLGCYQADERGFGACSYGRPIVRPDNPNPPDLSTAPPPPYLRDLLDPDADFPMVFGLTPDMLGYIMPAWNFELPDRLPYFEEAPGDHYEETNSIGPAAERDIVGELKRLLCWTRGGQPAVEACAGVEGSIPD